MIYWGRVDPTLLKPAFRQDVEEFLSASPYHWYVTEGYRSLERSAQLYDEYIHGVILRSSEGKLVVDSTGKFVRRRDSQGSIIRGPRAAPPGKSAHNYGLAIDVALDSDPAKPGLQPTWDVQMAGWIWIKKHSIPHPRLRNGWSFSDWPHIERYKWQRYT